MPCNRELNRKINVSQKFNLKKEDTLFLDILECINPDGAVHVPALQTLVSTMKFSEEQQKISFRNSIFL